jgi:hypothetical protein
MAAKKLYQGTVILIMKSNHIAMLVILKIFAQKVFFTDIFLLLIIIAFYFLSKGFGYSNTLNTNYGIKESPEELQTIVEEDEKTANVKVNSRIPPPPPPAPLLTTQTSTSIKTVSPQPSPTKQSYSPSISKQTSTTNASLLAATAANSAPKCTSCLKTVYKPGIYFNYLIF